MTHTSLFSGMSDKGNAFFASRWLGTNWSRRVVESTCRGLMCLVVVLVSASCNPRVHANPLIAILADVSDSMDQPLKGQNTSTASKLVQLKTNLIALVRDLPTGTRVAIFQFDHRRTQVLDIMIHGPKDRDRVIDAIDKLTTNRGKTHLWRSLRDTLRDMRQMRKTAGHEFMRLLVYSDNGDNESQQSTNAVRYRDVIDEFGPVISESFRVDLLTFGFDFDSRLRHDLEHSKFTVKKVGQAQCLIPLRADMTLDRKDVMVGESVTLTDRSIGLAIERRGVIWGDGSPSVYLAQGDLTSSHTYQQPGTYKVTFGVLSGTERSTSQTTIKVNAPPISPPVIKMVSYRVPLGESVELSADVREATSAIWTYGEETRRGSTATFRFDAIGTHDVELEIRDHFGQTAKANHPVEVVAPSPPSAKLWLAAEEVFQGDPVRVVSQSTGSIETTRWTINGKEVVDYNDSHNMELTADFDPGVIEIGLHVGNSGGSDQASARLRILPHPAPVPRLQLGANPIRVGETINILADSSHSTKTTLRVNGDSISLNSTSGYAAFSATEVGDYQIVLIAEGPGGTRSVAKTLIVKPLHKQPQAIFEPDRISGRGPTTVRFLNKSSGSVATTTFDFGDGTTADVDGAAEVVHEFPPGTYAVRATVYGPEGSSTVPDVWQCEVTVGEPIRLWILGIAKWPLLLLASIVVVSVPVWISRRRRDAREDQQLHGTITIAPVDDRRARKTFQFDGEASQSRLDWDDSTAFVVSSIEDRDAIHVRLETNMDGTVNDMLEPVVVHRGEDSSLEQFHIRFK